MSTFAEAFAVWSSIASQIEAAPEIQNHEKLLEAIERERTGLVIGLLDDDQRREYFAVLDRVERAVRGHMAS